MGSLISILVLLGLVSSASAQTTAGPRTLPRLSDHGRKLVSGQIGGFWSSDDQYTAGPYYDEWNVYAQPGLTYFVIDRVGLGAHLTAGYGKSLHTERYDLGLGGQALYDVLLGDRTGLLLVAGVAYVRSKRDFPGSPNEPSAYPRLMRVGYEQNLLRFSFAMPLVFHVSESVGIGFGPELWYDRFYNVETEVFAAASTRSLNRLQVGMSTWLGASF